MSSTTNEALAALLAVQMRLRTFRVIPVVNRPAHRLTIGATKCAREPTSQLFDA